MNQRTGRIAAALGVAVAAVVAGNGIAAAHVNVDPGEGGAGESTLLTFSLSHGCDGSSTTAIRIQIPESIPSVAPTMNAGWDVTKVMAALDAPLEGAHGEQLTERVAEVVYTAKAPLLDGYRDTFVLSVTLPDTPGETIYFPTIQTCEAGETAWIEIPAAGQDHDDLGAPAPAVVVAEAGAVDDHGGDVADDPDDA